MPVITVIMAIVIYIMMRGSSVGEKGLSKLNRASDQLATSAIIIPAATAIDPRKKYSSAVIHSICLPLAPRVLNKTFSCMRW